MRRVVQGLGWLALVAVAGGIWLHEPDVVGAAAEVTSFLTYPLGEPVRFSLEPGEAEIRLVSWLVRPEGWAGDPRVTAPYCLGVTVERPDGVPVLEQAVWIAARAGWTEAADGRRAPTAWLSQGEGEPASNRVTTLDLGGRVPTGGTLVVRTLHAPGDAHVLGVVFRRGERDAVDQLRLVSGQSPKTQARLAADVGAFEWAAVPVSWRAGLARTLQERLGALPTPTGRAPTVRLRTTRDPVAFEDAAAWGIALQPGGSAAWNVTGPTTFEGAWGLLDGAAAPPTEASLRIVHADGTVEERWLASSDVIGPIEIAEGLASVQITLPWTETARLVRVRTAGADDAWGDPPRLPVEAEGSRRVGVDLRRIEAFRVGGGGTPIRWPLAEGEPVLLLMRARLPTGPDPAPGDAVATTTRLVRVTAEDAAGGAAATWEIPIDAVPSTFERYTQVDTPASARVAEVETRAILPPPDAVALVVDADALVDVSVRVINPNALHRPSPDYVLPPDSAVEARYVPDLQDRWIASAPDDFERLAHAARIVAVDAQVRLEPEPPSTGTTGAGAGAAVASADRQWQSVSLPPPFEIVAEALATPRAPGVGGRIRVGAEPVTVEVGPDGRLALDYRTSSERIGTPVRVEVDGEPQERTLAASGGSLVFGPFPPGTTRVRVETPGLFLARPGARAADWQLRRVHRLDPDAITSIPWPGGAGAIDLHVYGAAIGATLSWSIEGPPGVAGVYDSLTERTGSEALAPTGAEAWALSFAADRLPRAAPVRVTLGADLGSTPGVVRVSLAGPSAAWLRVTSTFAAPEVAETEPTFGRRGAL